MQNIDWSSLGFRYMKTNSHIRYTWRNGAWDNNYFNRLNAHHIGIKGNPSPWLSWRAMYTYEKNFGSYDKPVMDPLKGHFLLLEATYKPKKLKGWGFAAAYGHNHGSLLGKANSAMLTVSFDGWIRKYN